MICRKLLLGSIFLVSLCSFAQTAITGLQITVTDSEGAVIPGVNITVVNSTTHFKAKLKTNMAGECRLPNLALGDYLVTAEKHGFRPEMTRARIASLDAGMVEVRLTMRCRKCQRQ